MKKKFSIASFAVAVVLTPALALAQALQGGLANQGGTGNQGFGVVDTFIGRILNFINDTLIPLVFAVALLVFIYGIFDYFILGGGDETKREEGRKLMLYAIVGFVVMVSIFGIVNLISKGLGFKNADNIINIPNVPISNT